MSKATEQRLEYARRNLDSYAQTRPKYQSAYGGQIRSTQSALSNMEPFSYDYTQDAAYQQYKGRYTKGAELAAEDAAAQSAARSGGYGNSWGTQAGQTAYQSTMNGLEDVANSLYSQALDEYNTRRGNLQDELSALQSQESLAQQQYANQLQNWNSGLNYYTNEYNSALAERQAEQQNSTNWWGTLLNVAGMALPWVLRAFGVPV